MVNLSRNSFRNSKLTSFTTCQSAVYIINIYTRASMLEFNHMSLECILSAEKTYSTAHKPASCRSQPVLALQAPESTKLKLHGALTGTMVLQKRRELYLPHTHTSIPIMSWPFSSTTSFWCLPCLYLVWCQGVWTSSLCSHLRSWRNCCRIPATDDVPNGARLLQASFIAGPPQKI